MNREAWWAVMTADHQSLEKRRGVARGAKSLAGFRACPERFKPTSVRRHVQIFSLACDADHGGRIEVVGGTVANACGFCLSSCDPAVRSTTLG